MLIAFHSFSEHLEGLKKLFSILQKHKTSMNFKTSKVVQSNIKFLGQVINSQGNRPDLERIERLKPEPPRTKRDLQKLLGVLN